MQPTEVKVEGGEVVKGGAVPAVPVTGGAVVLPSVTAEIPVSGGADDVEGGKKRSHKNFRKSCPRGKKRSRRSGRCVKKTSRVLSPGRRHRKACRSGLVRSHKGKSKGHCVKRSNVKRRRHSKKMMGGEVDKVVVTE